MLSQLADYDFADFGCSNGASIEQAKTIFGARSGVGIDISEAKVASARKNGCDAIVGDLTNLDVNDDAFQFVTMVHFLEHLPSVEMARRCIHTGVRASRDFVFIRQPWFSTDGYLAQLGLKQYWSDWSGHTNKMDLLDFYLVLRSLPKDWSWRLYGRYPIKNSEDDSIHPIASPIDQHKYDASLHGAKPKIEFSEKVFKETACFIYRSDVESSQFINKVSSLELLKISTY